MQTENNNYLRSPDTISGTTAMASVSPVPRDVLSGAISSTSALSNSSIGGGSLTYAADAQGLQEQADQLRQVALQMDTFLARQLDRLQRHLSLGSSCNQQEFAEIQAAFTKMKLQWEEERKQEKQSLLEDAQRLADAWQRLEHEQREILKQRASFKSSGSSVAASMTAPGSDHDPSLQPSRVEVKTKATPVAYPSESMMPAATAKNQMQFQQLRREMLEHSRQHRKR